MNWNGDTPYYGRDWFNRSVVLHRFDHGRRMYQPTPRWISGVERDESAAKQDKIVGWGCAVLFLILLVWGAW
jgi:hypothetical protein